MFKYCLNSSIRRLLALGLLTIAGLALTSVVRADQIFTGTAHTQMSGPGHAILGTLHLTLHEDEHGHPLSVVGDDPETGQHEAFKLQFTAQHHFSIVTSRGSAPGVFTVHVLAENMRTYHYNRIHFTQSSPQTLSVYVDLHKISAREIALSVSFAEDRFAHYSSFHLRATLHLKAPSGH